MQNAKKIPRYEMKAHDTAVALQYLEEAVRYYSRTEIAQRLGVDPSTVGRWLSGQSAPKPYVVDTLQSMLHPFDQNGSASEFTFIDLFAGIGGIRKAFELNGGRCVFTSEWDTYAQRTYHANFPDGSPIHGDITDVDENDVPNHDILLAGFPCQPFSIAGVSKKNALGRAHGFQDETQGTLFFDVARIIQKKKPKAFVLENVKNLQSHDKGRTFDVIIRTLRDQLGYNVYYRVIDGQHWTPQHRERIVIVGFRESTAFSWESLQLPDKGNVKIKDILHKTDGSEPFLIHDGDRYFNHSLSLVNEKYTLTSKLWKYLQEYAAKHRAKGNGFGYGLVGPDDISRTLSARYYKDGSEILVFQENKNPRRLTPRECARLMGYPDNFDIPVSDTRAYKQFGNSVVMPVFNEVARIVKPWIVNRDFVPVIGDLFSEENTTRNEEIVT